MALHLHLTIRYFSDRYHGSEWPPSPVRLFQALVAGGKTGGQVRMWAAPHEHALLWLETLDPPEILARRGQNAQGYTLFVPNNSLTDTTSTRTSKAVAPKVLVGHLPGDPDLVYRWRIADEDAARAHISALDEVASRLRALGWGVDFAAATAEIGEGPTVREGLELFVPSAGGGRRVAVPASGFLSHLNECHQAFLRRISPRGINPSTRPTRFGQARYRLAGSPQPRRWIAFELQQPAGGIFAAPWHQVQTVSAWLRHAAGQALLGEELDSSWVDSFVLGHAESGDRGYRLSYLPLPSVGYRHTDGGVRRALVVEPPDSAEADREALDLLAVKLPGFPLVDDRGVSRAVLVAAAERNKVLPLYTEPARVWETVTPVVLHGHNTARKQISLAKTDRLLRQAFESAGFPEVSIHGIAFQPAPYWPGCEAAAAIRVPRHLANWPRVHVRVEFNEEVVGPVLAGIGRHYGLGLFARR